MKSLVATATLIVLVLLGVLIYKESVPQAMPLEQIEFVPTEETSATTTSVTSTTTATTTEEEN